LSELGQLLKKARIERGLTLDDIQETTKIRKRYLELIEEGNYKPLPGNFYVRAFIKSYAEAVGLDPNETLRLYSNEIPPNEADAHVETIPPPRRATSKRNDKWSQVLTSAMLITFALLIVGLIYYFAKENYDGNNNQIMQNELSPMTTSMATATPTDGVTPTPTMKAEEPTPQAEPEVKYVRTEGAVDYYQVAHADKVKIELSLIGSDCWFLVDEVTDQNGQSVHKTILQGKMSQFESPQAWESEHSLYLRLGFPSQVKLVVNGVHLPLETSNPKSLQFELAPDEA